MMNASRDHRFVIACCIALVIFASIVLPLLVHPLLVIKWKLDLVISVFLVLLSVAWFIADCRHLGVRVRPWLVPAVAVLPFIIVPAHRFYETGAKQGAIFLSKVLLFMLGALATAALVYFSLDHFCEPVMLSGVRIDDSGYFQFWGCF